MNNLPPIGILVGMICLLGGIPLQAENGWQVIHSEQKGGLQIQLQLKEQIDPTQKEWIGLNISNEQLEKTPIKKAVYQIQLSAFEKNADDPIKEVFFKSSNPIDFFDTREDAPANRSDHYFLPAHSKNRQSISAKIAALLSYPKDQPWTVKASFSLQLELQDEPACQINWSAIDFAFQWYPPSLEDQLAAMEQLNPLLHLPRSGPYQEDQLYLLLNNPIVKKNLELPLLLKAIQLRNGQNDGRLALTQYLNENHPKEEKILAFYRKRLFKKDFRILQDLSHASNIWSDQFLEPIISWFQSGNSGVMIQIMEMLEVHQKDWIKKQGISTIFFDLIVYRYEDLIHKEHTELSDRELLVWCSAAKLLAKTKHPEARAIFLPYLKCKASILPKGQTLKPYSMDLPPPLRVADVALEGLLQLDNEVLEELYFSAGYRPPYAAKEAEQVISSIRDGLILLQQ